MPVFCKTISSVLLGFLLAFSVLICCTGYSLEKIVIISIFALLFMLCIIFDFILEYKSISFLRKEKLALLKRMTFGTDSTKQNSNENENCHIVIEEKDKENFKTFCSSLLEI